MDAEYKKPEDMIQALHQCFRLGAHKATAIAMLRKRAEILFVSDMDRSIVEKTFLTPVDDIQTALSQCLEKYGEEAEVIIMPYGGSTLPVVEQPE